ncbi:hypothetical protein ABEB36_006334 [Hypothenemus hampei]|uniref:Transmembrane protein 231 n=1 Tax=Hypothenemus hampei TaxID=57062 RepID=A0ABD1EQM6_HYPHA
MPVLEIYSTIPKIKYKAFLISKATFIATLLELSGLILPFVFCYYTGGFWLKRNLIYEQPIVRTNGKILFLATATGGVVMGCHTFPLHGKLDNCSFVKIREIDRNFDARNDFLELSITLRMEKLLKIESFHLVLPLNYSLEENCKFHMESAIVFQKYNLNGASNILINADLDFQQSSPIKCNSKPVIQTFQMEDFENILKEHTFREVKLILSNQLRTTSSIEDDHLFIMNLLIKIKENLLITKPKFWQILKEAWVQYLALWIIIHVVLRRIKKYIFDNDLVLLYKE